MKIDDAKPSTEVPGFLEVRVHLWQQCAQALALGDACPLGSRPCERRLRASAESHADGLRQGETERLSAGRRRDHL